MGDDDVTVYLEPQPHGGALKRAVAQQHVLHGEILSDPASGDFYWPPTLALEVAMQMMSSREICESYNISRERWDVIRKNPIFISEVTAASEALRQEGAAFKARVQLQALELLQDNWKFIHDPTCPWAVRADLLKHTIRVAGLDASKDQGLLGKGGAGGGLAININLGGTMVNG